MSANLQRENADFSLDSIKNSVSMNLRTYNVSNETIKSVLNKDIKFKDLSELDVKDLELFGVEDDELKQRMVNDFSRTPKSFPEIQLKKYLNKLNKAEYKEEVFKNMCEHLEALKITLSVCESKMKAKPIQENALVGPNTFTSAITIKALEQINSTATEINKILDQRDESHHWKHWIFGGGAIGLGCFAIYKLIIRK